MPLRTDPHQRSCPPIKKPNYSGSSFVADRMPMLRKGLVNLTPSGHESMAVEWFQKPVDIWGLNGESIRSYLLKDLVPAC